MDTTSPIATPWLIQGGMGIAISNWRLARAVARAGQIGVVSATALDTVFIRRLQDEGVDDELRAVLDTFPDPAVVETVLHRYASVRRVSGAPYRTSPMLSAASPASALDLVVLANFVEVALAKRGHGGPVGINLLTKVQVPTAASLYGAMLAGVDYVMMGAGVPTHIPGVLDDLAHARLTTTPLTVTGAASDHPASTMTFDPTRYQPGATLRTPRFVGIVSSHVLATALLKRSNGPVDGFVVERPAAGGHNAPPRGAFALDDEGGPVYGPRDAVDFDVMNQLGVPYWIGGAVTRARDVTDALALGAAGVQVGTLFAYCRESGMDDGLRRRILDDAARGPVRVTTSLSASSTGYPFKVVDVPGTLADPDILAARERHCDLGYLREAYLDDHGATAYRCAAEPETHYVRKGGEAPSQNTTCLCNGLLATCGLPQVRRDGSVEAPLVTSGDRVEDIVLLARDGDYGALDVIDWLNPHGPGADAPRAKVASPDAVTVTISRHD